MNRVSEIKIAIDLELEQPNTRKECFDSSLSERKIIQVGWVLFNQRDGKILKENQGFVNIGVPLSGYIKKLTGISDADISGGETLVQVFSRMMIDRDSFGADRILYQWGNDDESLQSELCDENFIIKTQGGDVSWPFGRRGINVKHLYRIYAEANGLYPSGGLSKCLTRLGLKWVGHGKHNAVVDARNTALMAMDLFKKISIR